MHNNFLSSHEVVNATINAGIRKTNDNPIKMILLGMLAGIFISFGAESSNLAMHTIDNVGIARVVGGTLFSVALMMVIFIGAELFTGNCLIVMAVCDKKVPVYKMLSNLAIVYISNFFGALLVSRFMNLSGQYNISDGLLGAYTIKVAIGKLSMTGVQAFVMGILCNVLVCAAIMAATSATDIVGKCVTIFFIIFVFFVSGFEHCVANMYYIPAAIMASHNEAYVNKAMSVYGITSEQISRLNVASMFENNLFPVTIGNILGGMFIVGILIYFVHKEKVLDEKQK